MVCARRKLHRRGKRKEYLECIIPRRWTVDERNKQYQTCISSGGDTSLMAIVSTATSDTSDKVEPGAGIEPASVDYKSTVLTFVLSRRDKPTPGFEPGTIALRVQCSTAELSRHCETVLL